MDKLFFRLLESWIQESPSKMPADHYCMIRQVLFLPGSRLPSCSRDTEIKVWDATSGKRLFQLKFMPASSFRWPCCPMASGSFDQAIRLWDLQRRKKMRMLKRQLGQLFHQRHHQDMEPVFGRQQRPLDQLGTWKPKMDLSLRGPFQRLLGHLFSWQKRGRTNSVKPGGRPTRQVNSNRVERFLSAIRSFNGQVAFEFVVRFLSPAPWISNTCFICFL